MSIHLHCSTCKTTAPLKSKQCLKCGNDFSSNGRKYRVIVRGHDGKRVTKVLDSISMAKKLERKLRTQTLEKTLLGINHAPLIDDVWKKYLKWSKNNKKTWEDDQSRWEQHIKPILKRKKMDAIIPLEVDKIVRGMKAKRDYAPATIRQVIVLVKRLYNWASEMGLYEGKNQVAKVKLPKINNQVTECLTRDEIKRLFDTLDGWFNQRAALLVKFALYTGLRRGEIFALKWKNVNLENGIIKLEDTKGGKDELLPVSDEALRILGRAKGLLPTSDCPYVFPNRLGKERTSFGNTWLRIKKSAKIPRKFRFHGLRHTYASYLASSGKVSQLTLQKLLTHKTPQMTQRYAHLFDETLREGANLLPTLI